MRKTKSTLHHHHHHHHQFTPMRKPKQKTPTYETWNWGELYHPAVIILPLPYLFQESTRVCFCRGQWEDSSLMERESVILGEYTRLMKIMLGMTQSTHFTLYCQDNPSFCVRVLVRPALLCPPSPTQAALARLYSTVPETMACCPLLGGPSKAGEVVQLQVIWFRCSRN